MRIGAIIFSRMSSSRLPGKAFMDISGKTLLERVIDRTKCLKEVDHICLATSINSDDDKIENYAIYRGIEVFRGSLNDVAERALRASLKYDYDHFIRICADRPFFDIKLYDHMILEHIKNGYDLTTNIFPRNIPPGFTGEIIKLEAFKKLIKRTKNLKDREHVTTYFYQNSADFFIKNVEFNKNFNLTQLRLVIDDKTDLERARWIAKNINEKDCNFNSNKIISLAKEWDKNNKINL